MLVSSQVVTLAGHQTKRVTVNLKIPEQGFTGVLLGGLYLVDQEETAGTTGDGVQFKNREVCQMVLKDKSYLSTGFLI
ncbi:MULTISPECIES: WxL protein peptidoglycan domain-containing protein [Lactobacillaceae]|uniref:WxL protein peptidoglycan domain-containing protein n=1 Tax=Lactobacillaceae TaxID=33958 RepID=UPI000572ED7A|nr:MULTISPECIES: DUF916 domain-containing protein [Lactobacillaceae]AJA81681.1 hypothetical protein L747_01150 [Levilactobacillus brevis BSO 464]MDA5388529.1 DUF916 domain-containing protein [Loigolactobacillus backii]MDA5391333.1 DUF916 domain-containing protein [Loigolactobacillus backii]